MKKALLPIFAAGVLLAGCAGIDQMPRGSKGAILGATAGGIAGMFIGNGGGQYLAIALGTILGGAGGYYSEIGLDYQDRAQLDDATQYALENKKIGSIVEWHNPRTDHKGAVTPTRTFYAENGNLCRNLDESIQVKDKSFDQSFSACRKDDGSWQIASAGA